jgi:phosphate transport system substrate-binding protein
MRKEPRNPAQAAAALKFFDWAYRNGDATAGALDYVPMPAAVKTQVRQLWAGLAQ